MSKIQTDSYKMNESNIETIDEDGELIRIDLILEDNDPTIFDGEITGKVMDLFGFPIVGAKVTLRYNSDKKLFKEVYSDENYTYLFEDVPINTEFQISASHPIYFPKTLTDPVIVETFETVRRDIRLISILGIIFGILLDIYKRPVAVATLFLYLLPPPPATPVLIDKVNPEKDGKFVFPEVPFGKYELVAQTGPFKDVSTTFTYNNPNNPIEINLEFEEEKPARIVGRILDTKNKPISGTIVTLKTHPEFLDVTKVFSDAFGNYFIENVVPNKSFVVSAIAMYYTQSTSPPITPAPASTVTQDLVLNDVLGSIIGKLLDTNSNPVSGNISLYTVSSNSQKLQSTTANENGNFVFNGIPRGDYAIVATNARFKEVSTSVSYNDPNFPLHVTLRFLEKNTSTILGKITDSKGSPISNAAVTLKSSPNLLEITKVFSDASGNYSINDILGEKSYIISIKADQYIESTSPVIVLDFGTTFTQNLSLKDLLGSIVGKLLGTDFKPIFGDVSLYTVASSSVKLQSTTANLTGDFTFSGISRGDYAIVANNVKYKEISNSYSYTDANFPLNVTLKFLEDNTSNIIGKITNNKGVPIANATVTLKSSPDRLEVKKVFSDASGNYSIKDVIGDKSYVVSAIANQYTESTSDVISLAPGITFTQNLSLNNLLGSIIGNLLDVNSKPIIADLSLYDNIASSNITIIPLVSNPLQTTKSDSSGKFTFNNIPIGYYKITATSPYYRDVSYSFNYDSVPQSLNINLKFSIIKGSIEGKVIDNSGKIITNNKVYLFYFSNDNIVKTTITDNLGYFNFGPLDENDYILGTFLKGYIDNYSFKITVKDGEPPQYHTLKLIGSGSLTGKIFNSSGKTLSNAHVYLYYSSNSNMIESRLTDSTGTFEFPLLSPNNYFLGAMASGYESKYTGTISISGNTANYDFYLNVTQKAALFAELFIDTSKPYSTTTIVSTISTGSHFNGAYTQWIEYWGNRTLFVLGIGGYNYGYTLVNWNFPVGGRYIFDIYYLCANYDRPLSINVAGITRTFTFPKTPGSWLTDARYYDITLYSPPGTQTIKYFNYGPDEAPALAYAHVTFVPFSKTIYTSQFEVLGGAYRQNGLIAGISSAGGSMKTTVSVDAPGYYDLKFKYFEPNATTKMKIKINGVDTGTTYYLPPSIDWSTGNYITVKLYLNNWTNTIEVYL